MELEKMNVDITKITRTGDEKLRWQPVSVSLRNFAIVCFVGWIMYDNIGNKDSNIVSMIFFGIVGISSLNELGFNVLHVFKKIIDSYKAIK